MGLTEVIRGSTVLVTDDLSGVSLGDQQSADIIIVGQVVVKNRFEVPASSSKTIAPLSGPWQPRAFIDKRQHELAERDSVIQPPPGYAIGLFGSQSGTIGCWASMDEAFAALDEMRVVVLAQARGLQ